MNILHYSGTIESKFERRQLSRLLKLYQFSCSEMKVGLSTLPGVKNIHKYDYYDPNSTLREDVTNTIRMLTYHGYKVKVDVKIQF